MSSTWTSTWFAATFNSSTLNTKARVVSGMDNHSFQNKRIDDFHCALCEWTRTNIIYVFILYICINIYSIYTIYTLCIELHIYIFSALRTHIPLFIYCVLPAAVTDHHNFLAVTSIGQEMRTVNFWHAE